MRLPSLDVRQANLTLTRFFKCKFVSIWASSARLDSATFCDCTIGEFRAESAAAERLLIRQREPKLSVQLLAKDGARRAREFALEGPWTRPSATTHASLDLAPGDMNRLHLIHANDEISIIVVRNMTMYCYETSTGHLRWKSYREGIHPHFDPRSFLYFEGTWHINLSRNSISCFVPMSGRVEEFQLSNGKRKVVLRSTVKRSVIVPARKPLQREGLHDKSADAAIQSYRIKSGALVGCTRFFVHGARRSTACFDPQGRLVDYDDEAANTWLRYLGNGYPQPVEAAWLELDEMGRSLGPKKRRD